MHGQVKVKNWVYMVVIPQAITSYFPVDIDWHSTPKVANFIHTYLHAFQGIVLIKKTESTGVETSINPTMYTRRISLLFTLVLSFTSDLRNNIDILLMMGFNYNFHRILQDLITDNWEIIF